MHQMSKGSFILINNAESRRAPSPRKNSWVFFSLWNIMFFNFSGRNPERQAKELKSWVNHVEYDLWLKQLNAVTFALLSDSPGQMNKEGAGPPCYGIGWHWVTNKSLTSIACRWGVDGLYYLMPHGNQCLWKPGTYLVCGYVHEP